MDMHDMRINLLRQRMAEEKVDLLTWDPGAHMQWLLGFHPHLDERPCLLFLSQNGIAFLMPAFNAMATRETTGLPLYEWTDVDGFKAALDHLTKDFAIPNNGQIALDETMRADFAALLQDDLPEATRQFSASTVGALHMRKDEREYLLLKENAGIADQVMQTV